MNKQEVSLEKKYTKWVAYTTEGDKMIETEPIKVSNAMRYMVKNGLVDKKGFWGVIGVE